MGPNVASSLNLGDEILAVNGQPLNGLTHKEAVARLKGAGLTLILRVRPNQALGGTQLPYRVFSTSTSHSPHSPLQMCFHLR